ncbi:MAG TPA: iron chelate uptake ABC transporter family permease subunit [Spongiibacteraceae bacterium]
MADFLLFAICAGGIVAMVAAPLGTLVVWQRLAYFGDTLAHSALLGTAFGLLLHINPWWTVFVVALLVGALLALLQRQPQVSADSLLGIIAHGSLALGLVAISFTKTRVDLNSYLFGDLLAVTVGDLWLIAALGSVIIFLLIFYWDKLLAITVHPELAVVEGLPVARLRLLQLLLLASLVAAAMKVVGVLLVTALLIIPANSARPWSRTPEQMAVFAAVFGAFAVLFGIALSVWIDTPTGASVVLCATMLFIVSHGTRKWTTA